MSRFAIITDEEEQSQRDLERTLFGIRVSQKLACLAKEPTGCSTYLLPQDVFFFLFALRSPLFLPLCVKPICGPRVVCRDLDHPEPG